MQQGSSETVTALEQHAQQPSYAMTSTPVVLPPAPAPEGNGSAAAAAAAASMDTLAAPTPATGGVDSSGGSSNGGNGSGSASLDGAMGNGVGHGDDVHNDGGSPGGRKRKLIEEAIPLGGDGIELLPPAPSLPASLKPFLDAPLPPPSSSTAAPAQQPPSQPPQAASGQMQGHPSSSSAPWPYPSLVPKPLSAVVLPPTTTATTTASPPQPPPPQQQQPTMTISPLMQPPAPGSFVPCHPPHTTLAFHHPPPPQQPPPQQQQQQQRSATEMAFGEGFPSLDRRRELMDATIAKLKADITAVRNGGLDSPLLLLYGARAVNARAKALADAERHRRHMEEVSEAMAQHGKEEAEATLKAGLDSVREQLVEERLHELRRCEEGLKAGVDAPLRTVMTRHSKAKTPHHLHPNGIGASNGNGNGSDGGGDDGGGRDGLGGGTTASSMARRRRRGQSPASAYLHKSLGKMEAEQDLSAMVADARYALESVEEGENGGLGFGGGGEGGGGGVSIPVRVEKGAVLYGGGEPVVLGKGTALLVTLPRTDDQYVATLQSFNQTEIFIKVHGGSGVTGLGSGLGASLGSSRKRIPLQDLMDGTVLLDVCAVAGGEGSSKRRGRSALWEDEEEGEGEEDERSGGGGSRRGSSSTTSSFAHGWGGGGGGGSKKRARLLMEKEGKGQGGGGKIGRPSTGRGSRGGRVNGGGGGGGGGKGKGVGGGGAGVKKQGR